MIAVCVLSCAIINPQWLELPVSRTYFYGPKDVRAIEIRQYIASVLFFLSISSPVTSSYYTCPKQCHSTNRFYNLLVYLNSYTMDEW